MTDNQYMYRDGILFLGVDNLPTEFPREATQWFGDHLLPFIDKMVTADQTNPYLLCSTLLLLLLIIII